MVAARDRTQFRRRHGYDLPLDERLETLKSSDQTFAGRVVGSPFRGAKVPLLGVVELGTGEQFEQEVENLRAFARQRADIIREEVARARRTPWNP